MTGYNSDDGGLDHDIEAATEELCKKVTSVYLAKALTAIAPAIDAQLRTVFRDGYEEGEEAAEESLRPREHR